MSDPLPAMAICHLIGVSPDDALQLVPLVINTGALLDGVTDLDGVGRASLAAVELVAYSQLRLDAARRQPVAARSGLLGVLIDNLDAGVVNPNQARDILVQLFSAGTETTSR